MRLHVSLFLFGIFGFGALGGCPAEPAQTGPDGLVSLVGAATESLTADREGVESAVSGPLVVSGALEDADAYELFPLTAAAAGEHWTVSDTSGRLGNSRFLVCLFNAEQDLLQRELVSAAAPLEHIMRADTATVYLGVAVPAGRTGGNFRFQVKRGHSAAPAPETQLVWLNFQGARSVSVNARNGLSFGPFDAAMLGSAYAGQTEEVKAALVAAMRADYAGYNVVLRTSDEGPPPGEPHATLYFGASDARLLGLADNVDQYNTDPWQAAVIYVESFADFAVLRLSTEEIGQMVGNVASHELGHLIGLFHTRDPADLMDTTGTARDLAGAQSFTRAPLEASVFPEGFEDSPGRLVEIVGASPAGLAKGAPASKMQQQAAIRALVRAQMPSRCGTCLHLDE
ncbi:MAG: hypothetical protein AB1716_03095 [Planctomycetota bacterium]